MIINEDHKASCWMNVLEAMQEGAELRVDEKVAHHEASEEAPAQDTPQEGGDA